MGLSVGFAILGAASIGAAFLLRPKGQHIKSEGPRLDELQATTSQYGIGIPRVWGAYTVPGNVIWVGKVREHKKTTTSRSGGKGGGGSKQTHTEYSYTVSVAIGLASAQHRPIRRVLRILMDNKVVYDTTGGSLDQEVKGLYWRFYSGSETQQPDSIIAAQEGASSTPAFRGLSYVVFDELPITEFGNRIPQMKFLVESEGEASCLTEPLEYHFGHGDYAVDFNTGVVAGMPLFVKDRLILQNLATRSVVKEKALGGQGQSYYGVHGASRRGLLAVSAGIGFTRRPVIEVWDGRAGTRKFRYVAGSGGSSSPETAAIGEYVGGFDGTHRTIVCTSYEFFWLGVGQFTSAIIADVENNKTIFSGRLEHPKKTIDPKGFNSFFVHKGDYATHTEFYWLRGGGEIDSFGSLGMYTNRMELYVATVQDRLKTSLFGYSIRPELIERRIATITPSTIDPQGRVPYMIDFAGSSFYGQTSCVIDGLVPCDDGGVIIFACSQVFTVKLNSSGKVVWRFQSKPSLSKADIINRSYTMRGYRAGSTVAVKGQKDGVDGIYALDVKTGDVLSFCPGFHANALTYDAGTQTVVNTGSVTYLDRFASGRVSVSTVINDLSEEVGLVESDFSDIAHLSIAGYMQAKPTSPKDMITPLANIFSFDGIESEGKLKWVLRGKQSISSYTTQDMIKLGDRDAVFEATRAEDISIPQAVSVSYTEEKTNHERNTVSRQRFRGNEGYETMRSRNQLNLEAPVSITANQAKQAADVILMGLWNGRTTYKLRLPRTDAQLDVGDVITLNIPDQFPEDIYIDRISIGADLQVEIEGASQDSSQYTSLIEGEVGEGYIPPVLQTPKDTKLYLLPAPYLEDRNDTQGTALSVYYAMGAYEDGWHGGVLERLTSSGAFEEVSLQPTSAPHGLLLNDLPVATYFDVFATNHDIHLDVAMLHGEPETVAYEDVVEGANAIAIIYSTNEVEIVQFASAELLDDASYRLTGIVRGQRGTDWLATTKRAPEGASIVFLSEGGVNAAHLDMDRLGNTEIFRGFNATQMPEDGDTQGLVVAGYEFKPWAPVHLSAEQVGGDIEVTWIRRTRLNGGLHDGSDDVPVGELEERYEIDVLVGQDVVRTLESGTESVTYTLAQRIEDETDRLIGSIEFHVYQISPIVGRGYRGVVTTKGVDIEAAQQSAGVLYELGRPDYDIALQSATVLQSLVIELQVAQQATIVLHEHLEEFIAVGQQADVLLRVADDEEFAVWQQVDVVIHEV